MKGLGGCLLVLLGFFGIIFAIVMSFTFYLLPVAFVFLIVSLIMISYAVKLTDPAKNRKDDSR